MARHLTYKGEPLTIIYDGAEKRWVALLRETKSGFATEDEALAWAKEQVDSGAVETIRADRLAGELRAQQQREAAEAARIEALVATSPERHRKYMEGGGHVYNGTGRPLLQTPQHPTCWSCKTSLAPAAPTCRTCNRAICYSCGACRCGAPQSPWQRKTTHPSSPR